MCNSIRSATFDIFKVIFSLRTVLLEHTGNGIL
jgi:hypothetical protein